MRTTPRHPKAVSRRRFLTGSAASGALAATGLPLSAPRAPAAGTDGILTAAHWGVMRARVEDGRFVSAAPFERDPFPAAAMVESTPSLVHSKSRVRYPMVRRGFLEKGPESDRAERGTGDFVRVSWDDALDLVARELQRVKAEFGPASFYVGNLGWKSAGRLHNPRAALARLMHLHGGFTAPLGDYSTGAAQGIMPHVMGGLEVYARQSAWPGVAENAELLVIWGADPLVTLKIGYAPPDHEGLRGFEAFRDRGTPAVVIDPRRTATADYLAAEWIAPRPGSDAAILLAIAHTLYAEGLHDAAFLDRYTVGFDRLLPYLTGASDGQPKDAAWAADIARIPAETIRDLARRMARSRTFLMGGWSLQRAENGEQTYWALVTVAAMLGQIGLPGGGFSVGYHYNSTSAPRATGAGLPGLTAGEPPADMPPRIPCARIADMLLNPGAEIAFNGRTVTYPDIRMVHWAGGNPLSHHQDRNRLIRAWRQPEVIVVQEPWWSTTARFADIVLPATTSFERNDIEICGDYSRRFIVPMHQLVAPQDEARNDYDIAADLADRLGHAEGFARQPEMALIRSYYDSCAAQAARIGQEMPSFEAFWESGGYHEFPVDPAAGQWVRHADFREDPDIEALGTPSGRIELFSSTVAGFGYDGILGHAQWIAPTEWLGSADAGDRLHLISPHPEYRIHSQMNAADIRRRYTVQGREPIEIGTADAAARGIADGDVVRVFNERGQTLAGAVVTDDLMPGVVRLAQGSWYDPDRPGEIGALDKYGSCNQLTRDIPSSPIGQATTAHTALVQVEKHDGPLPAVTAFDPPAAG